MSITSITRNALANASSHMTAKQIEMANKRYYRQKFLMSNIDGLRKRYSISKVELKRFSPSAISRMEDQADIKLSTLIEYLTELGFHMEIVVRKNGEMSVHENDIVILSND